LVEDAEQHVPHVGAALAHRVERGGRREDVAVDDVGAVGDLDEQVARVAAIRVPSHARPLGLPVEPRPQRAVVDEVVLDRHVDRGVELDPGDLPAEELAAGIDVVDVVAGNLGEDATQMADNRRLAAVVDVVVADDVGAHRLLRPVRLERQEDGPDLVLVAGHVEPGGMQVAAG
jgi:hypothetical protein